MVNQFEKFIKNVSGNTGVLIENPVNIRYLTKCNIDEGVLLVTAKQGYLFVDSRFILDVDKNISNVEVILIEKFYRQLKAIIKIEKIKRLVLEADYITLNRYNRYVEFLPKIKLETDEEIMQALVKQRSVKTPEEIEKIKIAQELADDSFSYILNYIKPGRTEKAIAMELENKLLSLGSEGLPFEVIVVSGKRSAIPHGKPSNKEVKRGELLTLDFGAKIQGYCSDMTRTISIGPMGDKEREVYNVVLEAQNRAIQNLKAGEDVKNIDKLARKVINKKGYGKYFTHALGHGVGLSVHEYPRIASTSEDVICSNSIVTVEPGIYIGNEFGVRIEDMLIVTDEGCVNITKSNKNIIGV